MKAIWSSACVAACLTAASAGSLAQDVTYRKDIKPLVEAKCAGCHGVGAPSLADFQLDQKKYTAAMKGPRIDTYADLVMLIGWTDTGAIMRRLDDGKNALAGGKPGNMYQFLGATEEERQQNLNTFKAWVGSEAWNLNRFKARGDVPGISKEQLEMIQVKY
jgi:hypothetical protein